MTERAVYFDSSKCTACKGCQVACKTWNNLPSPLGTNEAKWSGTHQNPVDLNGGTRLIITFNELEGDSKIKPVKWAFGRRACQHCTDAPCASVCPGGALVRNEETGFVEGLPGQVRRLPVLPQRLPVRCPALRVQRASRQDRHRQVHGLRRPRGPWHSAGLRFRLPAQRPAVRRPRRDDRQGQGEGRLAA